MLNKAQIRSFNVISVNDIKENAQPTFERASMRKAVTVLALTMAVLALCFFSPITAKTDSNVVINADGTVAPSTAPIRQDGDTYTLTGSYEGTLLIQKSNVVFDGAGNFILSPDNVRYCLKLDSVLNVTVRNLVVRGALFGCMYGVELVGSSNCLIVNNTITDVASIMSLNGIAFIGFSMSGGDSNVITKNTLSNNMLGMYFGSTTNNTVTENQITYTATNLIYHPDGISFHYASGNHIYHNTFNAAVGGQVGSVESNNTWDNGFPSGGNYWSNYGVDGSNFTKIAGTGIYDCPYLINDENIDYYPLVEPYTATTPVVTILSKDDNYEVSSVSLDFTVDQPAAWMGYSLDGAPKVTVSDNQTLKNLANGQHTVTVYANDSFGNIGSAEFGFTVSVPVSQVLVGGVVAVVMAVAVIGVIYISWRKKKLLT